MKNLELVYKNSDIHDGIKNLVQKLRSDFEKDQTEIFFIIVLKGALQFFSDFYYHLDLDINYGFCKISSYEEMEKKSFIDIKFLFTRKEILNKRIIIVEDIFDSGKTIKQLYYLLKASFEPKTIEIITLIQRYIEKENDNRIKIVNHHVFLLKSNRWIVGYGLDVDNHYRYLKNIYFFN